MENTNHNFSSTIATMYNKLAGQLSAQGINLTDYVQKIDQLKMPILESLCKPNNGDKYKKIIQSQQYQMKVEETFPVLNNHKNLNRIQQSQPVKQPKAPRQQQKARQPKGNYNHTKTNVNQNSNANLNENGNLVSSLIEGCVIAGFNVWGEKRICLPHLLRFVLNEIDIESIGIACSRLKITCTKCSSYQLNVLHQEKVLPKDVQVCGLMRKSDAERLVKYLKGQKFNTEDRVICVDSDDETEDESSPNPCRVWTDEELDVSKSREKISSSDEMTNTDKNRKDPLSGRGLSSRVEVIHECFGKQRGYLLPEIYDSPTTPCIECKTCKNLFNPMQFVGHTHHLAEIELNHWGFDSTNWRCYLRAYRNSSKDCNMASFRIKSKILEDFKVKFLKPINLPSKLLNALKKCKDTRVKEEELEGDKVPSVEQKDKNPALITKILPNLTLRRIWAPNDGQVQLTLPKKHNFEKIRPKNLHYGTPLLEKSNRVWNLEYAASFGKSFIPNVSLKVCPENCRIPYMNRQDCKTEKFYNRESPWYSGTESLASSSNSLNHRSRCNSGTFEKFSALPNGLQKRSYSFPRLSKKLEMNMKQIRPSKSLDQLLLSASQIGHKPMPDLDNKCSPVSFMNSEENPVIPTNRPSEFKFSNAMNAAFEAQKIARLCKLKTTESSEVNPHDKMQKRFRTMQKNFFRGNSLPPQFSSFESLWSQVNLHINQYSNQCCNEVNRLVSDLSRLNPASNVASVFKSILEERYRLQENITSIQKSFFDLVFIICQENSHLKETLDGVKDSFYKKILYNDVNDSIEKTNLTSEFEADSSGIQQIFSQENSPCGNTGITNSTSSPASTDEHSQLKVQISNNYECFMPPHKKRYKMSNDISLY